MLPNFVVRKIEHASKAFVIYDPGLEVTDCPLWCGDIVMTLSLGQFNDLIAIIQRMFNPAGLGNEIYTTWHFNYSFLTPKIAKNVGQELQNSTNMYITYLKMQ